MAQSPDASEKALSILVIGASGDLARKKVLPALFALYCQGFLPKHFCIIGFARTGLTDQEFRDRVQANLTCRYVPSESCESRMSEFLSRCHYVSGQYDSVDGFLHLYQRMADLDCGVDSNHIFYMSIPPFLFVKVARAIGDAGLVSCGERPLWSRVVIEKPFGRDRASSDELVHSISQVFTEDQTYRIDHYLGKEVIQNLLVLRFANLVFEPVWNSTFIESVQIFWKEDISVGDRGGYFDQYGIIRDVVQNHLAQILALVAMEPPATLEAHHISEAKTRVLRSVIPPKAPDWILGQYHEGDYKGAKYKAYLDEPGIPAGSNTDTFAAGVLHIDNDRWRGTPFVLYAGKGLNERMTEIRIRFRRSAWPAMGALSDHLGHNELVIRVQPDERIRLGITGKLPGLEMKLAQTWLNLAYQSAFNTPIPDAYECLLLDIMEGDRSLFISREELAAAWDIFTPMLRQIEQDRIAPLKYAFGSCGPQPARRLLEHCSSMEEE